MNSKIRSITITAFCFWTALHLQPGHAAQLPAHPRIAVQPAHSIASVPIETAEQHRLVLSAWFNDKMPDCRGIRLVDPGRSAALFMELSQGADVRPQDWLPVAQRIMPLEALLTFHIRDGQASLSVLLEGQALHFPPAQRTETATELIARAVDFVADSLDLAATDRQALLHHDFPGDDALRAVYLASRLYIPWPQNTGEGRLVYLRSVWSNHRGYSRLGAEVLNAAAIQIRSTGRDQTYTSTAMEMAQVSLPSVLGTPHEATAADLVSLRPDAFANLLIDLAKPVTQRDDDLDAALDELLEGPIVTGPPGGDLLPGLRGARDAADWGGEITDDVRRGALRMLGFIDSRAARDTVYAAANHPQPEVRQAAAVALGRMSDNESITPLQTILADPDPVTSFLAARALANRDRAPANLVPKALAAADQVTEVVRQSVIATLALPETPADHELLRAWRRGGDQRQATVALLALARAASDPAVLQTLLDDPRTAVVDAVMTAGAARDLNTAGWIPALVRIANEPFQTLANPARRLLEPHRPADTTAAMVFDLEIEHPYRRQKLLESLAQTATPEALAGVLRAVENRDAYARARALELLARHDSETARQSLLTALDDPHRSVRLAAAQWSATTARLEDRLHLESALDQERDQVIRLYLQDALAAIGAAEPPPPQPAARSVRGERNLSWVTGMGLDAADSPFDAYYCLSPPSPDRWQQAHEAGKIVFVRYTPIGHPGLIMTDPQWRDRFQRTLNFQVSAETLPWLDGMVFGEETMNMNPDSLWASGWRLFCQDHGIDPDTLAGEMDNLDGPQRRAWRQWAMARGVEGFNVLTDYVRSYFGRLRPGIQVATFLPGEASHLGPWALDWEFDVAGIYDYKGDNRLAGYNLVRRIKTLWPERPILWLSLGIGGYEMNPVRRTQRVPQAPMFTRSTRSYADAMTAWMAGADTGWFSTWIFVDPDWRGSMHDLSGVQILVEDIILDSPVLQRAINYAFRGAEDEILAEPAPEVPGTDPGSLFERDTARIEAEMLDLLEGDEQREQAAEKVAQRKEEFRRGFHFYGRYVYDCARLFASLPRLHAKPNAISVRPSVTVWTRPNTPYPLVPPEALLNEYDFADDINVLAELDLSRYRLIILHDPGVAEPQTLAAIGQWLRDVPGLLYVHRNPPRPTAEADASEWPWNLMPALTSLDNVARNRPGSFTLSDAAGQEREITAVNTARLDLEAALLAPRLLWRDGDGHPLLAVWHDPAVARGALMLDGLESADTAYLTLLRDQLNRLHDEHGIGRPITGPLLQIRAQTEEFQASSTTRFYSNTREDDVLPGIDLLTGEPDPDVGSRWSAAIVASDSMPASRHIAAGAGLSAISDRPFASAVAESDALVLESPSVFRISGGRTAVRVTRTDGSPLPEITDDPLGWIEWGTTEGLVVREFASERAPVVYVRSSTPVRAVAADE